MVHHPTRKRSSSRDSHDSQSSSLGRSPIGHSGTTAPTSGQLRPSSKDTLGTSVIGPAKGHVTRITKRAKELLTAAKPLVSTLQWISPEQEGYQQCVVKADGLLVSMKRYAHKLGSVHNYVLEKFATPEMEASPDKEKFLQEVRDKIASSGAEILGKELQITSKTLEAQLTSLNFSCTQYVPSDGISSDEEDTTEIGLTSASALPQAGSATTQTATTSNSEDSVRNTGYAEPIGNIEAGSQEFFTPIMPQASRTLPATVRPHATAEAAIARQNALDVLALKAELEKERMRRRAVEAENLKTESEYRTSYSHLQDTCLAALQRAEDAEAQAARKQNPAPTPIVDAVPNANMTAEPQQSDLHPLVLDAIKMMHQDTLKSAAGITAAMDKLTSCMTDWRREKEDERYADEYERHARGAGADDDTQSTPPPTANFAEAPNAVPVPQAQFLRRFDATKYLSEYDGSGDLDVFQSTFERVVMNDQTYTFDDRYLLLRKTLKGKAIDCLTHDVEPEMAIKKTFAALNRAFGHNQTENSLLGKLASLPFHQTDPKQMRLDMVNITVVIERLKQKGIPQTDKRTIWDIASKLPPSIQRDIADYLAENENSVTHDLLVEKIFARITALDMRNTIRAQGSSIASNEINEIPDSYASINHVNASHHNSVPAGPSYSKRPAQKSDGFRGKGLKPLAYKADSLPVEYADPIYGLKLPGYYTPGPKGPHIAILHRTFPSATPETIKCSACGGPHNAMRCSLSSTEFRETLKAKKLCPICAGGHEITQCRSPYRCGYCDGLHHMGSCTKKEFYRIPANLPQGVKGRETFFRDPRGHASQ